METEKGYVFYEWRIENFSHWCAGVHGKCIKTLASPNSVPYCSNMELYPKGISGKGEHLVVRLCGVKYSCSGELSFHSSDGSLLCKQQVNADGNKNVLELPPGPKLEDVLFRIRESGDIITVRCRIKSYFCYEQHIRTTINVFKISLKIKPSWIEKMKSEGEKEICGINFSTHNYFNQMRLKVCSKNNIVHFMITPPIDFEYPFAIALCMSLTRSDDTVDNCLKKEHVFVDMLSPWTFPDPLEKKELAGKGISLFLCLKTKNLIQNHHYANWDYSNVSIEWNNTPCFSEKSQSTDPVTSSKVEGLTKDSESPTSLTSVMPHDLLRMLSNELMCLYQDQDFSDITLKCDSVSFPVHKAILSARSPVFKTMLSTDMAEAVSSEVVIGDLDPSTLSRFLTHLYTGAVEEELQDDRAFKLYYASDKYQVPSLKKECSKFLCSNVSISNVCDVLSLADRHRDDQLTSVAQEFILNNFDDVLKSEEWERFMGREPLLAVKTVTHLVAKDCVLVRKQEYK